MGHFQQKNKIDVEQSSIHTTDETNGEAITETSTSAARKTYPKRVLFSQAYKSHCNEHCYSIIKIDGRYIQKKSKKCRCTARLKLIYYTKNPLMYLFNLMDPPPILTHSR
jgi:hypothetical protein